MNFFLELDPWDQKIVKKHDHHEVISWSDIEAVYRNPDHSWVYNKFELATKLKQAHCWDLGHNLPPESRYPVFIRPITNLSGMSRGARITTTPLTQPMPGFMAQPIFRGIQYSFDYLIDQGKTIASYGFKSHKNSDGSFTHFESVRNNRNADKIAAMLPGYTGLINVEYIEDYIIEIHLRPSVQFHDISDGMIQKSINYMRCESPIKINHGPGISLVYRTCHDFCVEYNGPRLPGVQFTFTEGFPLSYEINDEFSYRYLVVNSTTLEDAKKIGEQVHEGLVFRTWSKS